MLLPESILDLVSILTTIIFTNAHFFIPIKFLDRRFILSIRINLVRRAHFSMEIRQLDLIIFQALILTVLKRKFYIMNGSEDVSSLVY